MPNLNSDPFDPYELKRIRLFVYLVPVIGVFPAIWALYRRKGDRRERAATRLVVVMALTWVVSYFSLAAGAQSAESLAMPLMLTSSVITSSYFVISLWLMLRVWQRKPLRLPGFSELGDRLP